jgi:DNA-binding response OmpR family regulator
VVGDHCRRAIGGVARQQHLQQPGQHIVAVGDGVVVAVDDLRQLAAAELAFLASRLEALEGGRIAMPAPTTTSSSRSTMPSCWPACARCDEASGEVRCRGARLDLRPSERRLLAVLLRSSADVVAKSAIEDALSEYGREISANAVEALTSRLRRALATGRSGLSVETVRGIGYQLREEPS